MVLAEFNKHGTPRQTKELTPITNQVSPLEAFLSQAASPIDTGDNFTMTLKKVANSGEHAHEKLTDKLRAALFGDLAGSMKSQQTQGESNANEKSWKDSSFDSSIDLRRQWEERQGVRPEQPATIAIQETVAEQALETDRGLNSKRELIPQTGDIEMAPVRSKLAIDIQKIK